MTEARLLLFIILGNAFIGFLYFLVLFIKKENEKALIIFLFILICPVISVLYLSGSSLLVKLLNNKIIDKANLSFDTEKKPIIAGPDIDKEINIVSVEEALLISGSKNKRRVILDVLKEDYNDSLSVINSALESSDSETSHYAASIITDVKSNFKITVQRMREKLDKFPNDPEISCLMVNFINEFLQKKVLSEIEQLTYIEQSIQILDNLYMNNKKAITSDMYKHVIEHLLRIGKNNEALIWGKRSINEYPNELNTYKGILKLYYETGEKTKFFEVLKKLKDSNLEFDNECIELIRFYKI